MRIIFTFAFTFIFGMLWAQSDTLQMVKYTNVFRFKEGIYLNYEQMATNKPIAKSSIISKFNKNSFDFFENLVEHGSVKFFDQYGLLKEMDVRELWGFCRKGSVFINWGDDFTRITVMGNICHFVSTITYNDNIMLGSELGVGYYNMPSANNKSQIQQFIMEFESGKVYEYNKESILELLEKDPMLYEEYNSLKKRKQKQMKFLFIRKFNEKHPLYIPIN